MASFSIAQPLRSQSGCWKVLIDTAGVIQSADGYWPIVNGAASPGSLYFPFLAKLCGDDRRQADALRAGVEAVSAGHADRFSLEFACRFPDGSTRMRLAATPYRHDGFQGVLLVHTEAGPPEPSADSDPQSYQMEVLGRLTGGVVHDFANLVTLIAGYSEILLKRARQDDPARPELEEIHKAAERGAGMTAHILDFIRKQAAPSGSVDLNGLVNETVCMLRPIIGEHIHLVTELDPHLDLASADPGQMTRVIMNLVLNARDAMPRGGRISIRTANERAGRRVTLEIDDDGSGMDAETMRRLFDPFFTTKENAGTGLGLCTVWRLVQQANGEIRVHSDPGEGSTFTICLPCAAEAGETDKAHTPRRAAGGGSETILLAEDDDSVRKLLKHLLTAGGYRVLDAVDGEDALGVFAQHAASIDLLLTDVVMPGMNGRDLAEQVRAAKPGLKVIYMSGYTEDVSLAGTALGPGVSYLHKPLRPDMLASVIRELLDATS